MEELKRILNQIEDYKNPLTDIVSDKPDLISFYNKYKSSFNKAIVETKFIDGELIIIKATKNIADIMGYSSEEILNTNILNYRASPLDNDILMKMIILLNSGEVITKRNTIINKKGNIINVAGILFKDGDKYIEFVWNSSDEFNLG